MFHSVTMLQAITPVKTNDLCKERYGFEFQDPDTIDSLKHIRSTPQKQM